MADRGRDLSQACWQRRDYFSHADAYGSGFVEAGEHRRSGDDRRRARLSDMDKVKIDTQVVFPSLFLTTTAEDVRLEAALLRSLQ